jgi:hypothetical protein
VILGTLPLPVCSLVFVPAPKGFGVNGSYSYPSIPPWREDHLINAISVEEELGRAQSKPTHAKAFGAG